MSIWFGYITSFILVPILVELYLRINLTEIKILYTLDL